MKTLSQVSSTTLIHDLEELREKQFVTRVIQLSDMVERNEISWGNSRVVFDELYKDYQNFWHKAYDLIISKAAN